MFSLPFRIAEYIGRKKRNGMTLFAYAFYTLFCLSRYMPIRQICEDYRVTVSAMGLIAYVLNDRWTQFIFMLCWFYLIGDGPFFDCTIQYVLLRSGRIKWATGVFLFVLLSAAYFLLWAAVLCVVCAFPYVNFQTEWDSVIRSLAAIRTLGQNYHAYFIFTPVAALSAFGCFRDVCKSVQFSFQATGGHTDCRDVSHHGYVCISMVCVRLLLFLFPAFISDAQRAGSTRHHI